LLNILDDVLFECFHLKLLPSLNRAHLLVVYLFSSLLFPIVYKNGVFQPLGRHILIAVNM